MEDGFDKIRDENNQSQTEQDFTVYRITAVVLIVVWVIPSFIAFVYCIFCISGVCDINTLTKLFEKLMDVEVEEGMENKAVIISTVFSAITAVSGCLLTKMCFEWKGYSPEDNQKTLLVTHTKLLIMHTYIEIYKKYKKLISYVRSIQGGTFFDALDAIRGFGAAFSSNTNDFWLYQQHERLKSIDREQKAQSIKDSGLPETIYDANVLYINELVNLAGLALLEEKYKRQSGNIGHTGTLHWDDDIGKMLYSDEEIKEVNKEIKSLIFTERALDMFSRQSELSDRAKKTFLKESFECLRKFYKERWGVGIIPYYE